MATTSRAPTTLGGAGDGMSNHRQNAPMPNAMTMPMPVSIIAYPTAWFVEPCGVRTPTSAPPQFSWFRAAR